MKKNDLILLICLLVILFVGFYSYQYSNVKGRCMVANNVNNVTQKVKNIEENIPKYSVTSKDIFDKSTEGGQQTNYTFNDKTLLIKQIFFGETGKSEADYFLENNKVFYFQKTNTEYTLPIYEDPSGKVKNIEIKEFYLDNNQNLCSWYLNQNLQVNDVDTKDLVKYLILGL